MGKRLQNPKEVYHFVPEKQEILVQDMFFWKLALILNVIGNTYTLKRRNKWKRRNKKGQQ